VIGANSRASRYDAIGTSESSGKFARQSLSEEKRTRYARCEFCRSCRVARRNLTPGRSQIRA
jgi:hypothetical protein